MTCDLLKKTDNIVPFTSALKPDGASSSTNKKLISSNSNLLLLRYLMHNANCFIALSGDCLNPRNYWQISN